MNWKKKLKGTLGRLLYVFAGAVVATVVISTNLSIDYSAQKFGHVIDIIEKSYVEPDKVSNEGVLYEIAVNSILEKIGDKHGRYISREEYKAMQEEGNPAGYAGVGIEISWYDNRNVKGVFVNEVYDGPAKAAGIKVKDIITKVDGESYDSVEQYVEKIKGPSGTFVTVTINRFGSDLGELTIERDYTHRQNVFSTVLPNNVIYVRIRNFIGNTVEEVEEHISNRIGEMEGDPIGIIVDGRYNPGGYLSQAHAVSDLFIPKDLQTVTTDGRDDYDMDMEFVAEREPLFPENFPVVILTNGYCASACEILAASTQHHQVSKIVGTKTYGKGSVQSIIPLGDGSAIKLTTALYYAGGEIKVDGNPVEPDITVNLTHIPNTPEEHAETRILISSVDLEHDPQLKAAWDWIIYAHGITPEWRYTNQTDGPNL